MIFPCVYNASALKKQRQTIEQHFEEQGLNLTRKNRDTLLSAPIWEKQRQLMSVAKKIQSVMGDEIYNDFNQFKTDVDKALKQLAIKLAASPKTQILNAISWRDENACPVVKKVHTLEQVATLLSDTLNHMEDDNGHLEDYGFWRLKGSQFTEYEPDSELRDTENVPLSEDFHQYFIDEVRPHVADAWIALDKTQLGCEISFNKYFYQHKPLRSLEAVTEDILRLEKETEGLLKKLVSFGEQP